MKIDSYVFGSMTVDGRDYDKDLVIYPDRIADHWWRKEGHSLGVEDLTEVLEYNPDILVIGRGYSGFMKVPADTKRELNNHRIQVVEGRTGEVYSIFNDLVAKGRKVVGAFHLTC